jgi:hypothetical protein
MKSLETPSCLWCARRYEAVGHVLHCLGVCEFSDFFAAHFQDFFAAALVDPRVTDTLTNCFKHTGREQERNAAPYKHTALAIAALRYLTQHELDSLEDASSLRARISIQVAGIVFDWMQGVDSVRAA